MYRTPIGQPFPLNLFHNFFQGQISFTIFSLIWPPNLSENKFPFTIFFTILFTIFFCQVSRSLFFSLILLVKCSEI